jgi:2-polyprenyl-6-methoxyphenol hydroxylase-like FAD-dependent oxidoreductase
MTKVAIVGSGIAGPALAIALKRAGIDSIVYESSATPRDQAGAFLNLAPNGLNALGALGLQKRVAGLGFQNDRLIFCNEAGRVLAETSVGGVTLMRGDLSQILREAAIEAGIPVEFGKRLREIQSRDGRVILTFDDQTRTEADAAVGADGIHSRTRSAFFPDAPKTTYTGIINLGGIVRTDLPPTGTAMRMIFGRRAFFGYVVRPDGDTYWFSNFAQSEEPARDALNSVEAAEWKQRLLAFHRDDPSEVTAILQAITDRIGTFAVYDIPMMRTWHRDAVCLIGDAAHAVGPHIGQGASLALEDAFELARCLRDRPSASEAFTTFEGIRRDRAEAAVKQSRRTGNQKAPTGAIGRRIRDLVLPVFLRLGAKAAQGMYAYPFNWDERVV